jgi:hypothetical protein
MSKEEIRRGFTSSSKLIEHAIDVWQNKVTHDNQQQKFCPHGDLLKFIVAQTQEFLYVIHKVVSIVDPSANVLFRSSTALPAEKKMPKAGGNAKEKIPTEMEIIRKSVAEPEDLGFESEKKLLTF